MAFTLKKEKTKLEFSALQDKNSNDKRNRY